MLQVGAIDAENGYQLGLIAVTLEDKMISVQVVQTCEALTWGWLKDGVPPKVVTTLRDKGMTSHQFKISL